jgi:hypothetical protein
MKKKNLYKIDLARNVKTILLLQVISIHNFPPQIEPHTTPTLEQKILRKKNYYLNEVKKKEP